MTEEKIKKVVDGYKPKTEQERQKLESVIEAYGEAPKLDLSVLKNAKAAAKKESISEVIERKAEKEKKSKFSFTEEHEFPLPTKGYLYKDAYDDDIRNGVVRLRPMTLKDEEILSNQTYIKNGSVFRRVIDSCMLNDFPAARLTAYDTYYIIYALREITYGQDYKFDVECQHCGKKFEYEMKLDEVDFDDLKEDIDPVKVIKLPISKYTVSLRYPSIGDEEAANKMQTSSGEIAKSFAVRTEQILDDNNEPVNPIDFAEFYEAIPGKDRMEITKAFTKLDELQIPVAKISCPECDENTEMEIPFTRDFFRY